MMKNSPRSTRNRRYLRLLILVAGAAVLAVLVVPRPLGSAAAFIFVPTLQGGAVVLEYAAQTLALIPQRRALQEENERLRRQLEARAVKDALYDVLAQENDRLRGALAGRREATSTIARILVRPPRSLYDTFRLDAGARQGIKAGDLVMLEQAVLGRIARADRDSSLAVQFSSPGELTRVLVHGSSTVPATLIGDGGGSFHADIPRGAVVAEGAPVTLLHDARFLVGVVASVIVDPADPLQRLYVTLPVNPSHATFVHIQSLDEAVYVPE